VQFSVDDADGFFVTVADDITVYEAYEDAVADIRAKLQDDAEGFLAKVSIEGNGDTDDVAVALEQVSWPQIIRDMDTPATGSDSTPSTEGPTDGQD